MKNLLFLAVLSLVLSASSPSALTTLSGKVVTIDTGEALIGASVILYHEGILKAGTVTDMDGIYQFKDVLAGSYDVEISYTGFQTSKIKAVQVIEDKNNVLDVKLATENQLLDEITVTAYKVPLAEQSVGYAVQEIATEDEEVSSPKNARIRGRKNKERREVAPINNNNEYGEQVENTYKNARQERFSTFGIDVDRASYSIVRKYLNNGSLPPADAVRTEELINYFSYDYAQPIDEHPFAVHSEWATCPWDQEHLLLSVALQGECADIQDLPPSNLTFLLDVSGSMNHANKLPLVKSSMNILLNQLKPEDKVSIVVYAGATGVVLPPTAVAHKELIMQAMDQLKSGGSTAGAAGIELAYKLAREQYVQGGNNRVILATDGDFNIGASGPNELESLIEKQKDDGIFLTVLGFGMGNLKDNRMERLADKGNGMYAYIDTKQEAHKIFGVELTSSLYTIAKDVKLQLRFNPKEVSEYRLIGYENRMLNTEDFDDDTKDAGELGAGHTVTALYEVIPASKLNKPVNLELRYKRPLDKRSALLEHKVGNQVKAFDEASLNLQWAATVASYAMLLKDSPYKGDTNLGLVQDWAIRAKGPDYHNFRSAFIDQIQLTRELRIRMGLVE